MTEDKRSTMSKAISLNMIVRNEAAIIRRCLGSAMPLVDYFFIVDTGSTDGTQRIVREFLSENQLSGEIIEEPWQNFAYNRSFALKKLREIEHIDYALIIDADDTLDIDPKIDLNIYKSLLTCDIYDMQVRHGNIVHYRPQMVSNKLPFSWRGVVHEFLECPPEAKTRDTIHGIAMLASTSGSRAANPRKYFDDAEMIEKALLTETDPLMVSRYRFYLAQSYRDSGQKEKALENYLKRVDLAFWDEERYMSLLEAGHLMVALGSDPVQTYTQAIELVPKRAEGYQALAHYLRSKQLYEAGANASRQAIDLQQPVGLFIQPWVYNYGVLDEFSVNAYWSGSYRESLDACLRLLTSGKLPIDQISRVAANAKFAADKALEIADATAKKIIHAPIRHASANRGALWILPTFSRPDRCQETLDSIEANGHSNGIVWIDGSQDSAYLKLRLPLGWEIQWSPENRGVCGVLNAALELFPDEKAYGFITDDSIVKTPDWAERLFQAAGSNGFANSGDGWQSRMHGAVCFGGDLLRTIGYWAPAGLKHCFVDDAWETLAGKLGNWTTVSDVMVEHRHYLNSKAAYDESYRKAYSTFDADKLVFERWLRENMPGTVVRAKSLFAAKAA